MLSRRLPGLNSYLLPLGIIHGSAALIILFFQPLPADVKALPLLAALGSGLLSGASSIIMLNTLRSGEISRIIPVISISPIFVALFAIPLLGDTLNSRDWSGIILTVVGAVLISIQKDTGGKKTTIQKSFFALALCSILFALSTTISKYALESLSFWNLYSASAFCMAILFILFSARPLTFREIRELPQRNRLMSLTVLAQSTIVVAIVLANLAIQRGPVAPASTVMSIRPAFVFLFTLILSRFFPNMLNERLTKSIALLKFTAIALIVGGVALLTL
jgi:drug/metabolite transporter (DMT)-like permease